MKQTIAMKLQLMILFRKTAFLYGIVCGLALVFPLVTVTLIPNILLRIIMVLAILFGGIASCIRLAENKMERLNRILYTDIDPEMFLDEFIEEIYSKKPEKWNTIVVLMIAQAYHALGRFKEEETLYINQLNYISKTANNEIVLKNELALIGRLTILYSDVGNTTATEKAFDRFREAASKITFSAEDKNFEDLKNLAYNCYLKSTGKIEECLGFFEWHCENRPNELGRITAHFRLAEVYAAGSYTENAEKEYRIVAEQGKLLYIAEKAAELLSA